MDLGLLLEREPTLGLQDAVLVHRVHVDRHAAVLWSPLDILRGLRALTGRRSADDAIRLCGDPP
jgi:hypothetical protein